MARHVSRPLCYSPLMTPQKLGHYEIVEQLGAGGMGEVYRARDTGLGREVAIKILPEAFASDEERRPDGKYLYYRNVNALYRTTVRTAGDGFHASRPEKVIEDLPLLERDYSVLPDGSVVAVGSTGNGRRSGELVVVKGFFEELKKLVPVNR